MPIKAFCGHVDIISVCKRLSMCYLLTVCQVAENLDGRHNVKYFELCNGTSACKRFESECDSKTGRCPAKCDVGFGGTSCKVSK